MEPSLSLSLTYNGWPCLVTFMCILYHDDKYHTVIIIKSRLGFCKLNHELSGAKFKSEKQIINRNTVSSSSV